MPSNENQAPEIVYAMDCTTGAVYVGSDMAERDVVFADAEALRQEAHEAHLAQVRRLREIGLAHEAAQAQAAAQKAVAVRKAMERLQSSHPEVADLIGTILS